MCRYSWPATSSSSSSSSELRGPDCTRVDVQSQTAVLVPLRRSDHLSESLGGDGQSDVAPLAFEAERRAEVKVVYGELLYLLRRDIVPVVSECRRHNPGEERARVQKMYFVSRCPRVVAIRRGFARMIANADALPGLPYREGSYNFVPTNLIAPCGHAALPLAVHKRRSKRHSSKHSL